MDGNDLLAVWQTANAAIRRAREGGGPTLVEARTYRTRGHVEYEHTFLSRPYREESEVEEWLARDPIPAFAKYLVESDQATQAEIDGIAEDAGREIADAVAYANAGDWPEPADALSHMFA